MGGDAMTILIELVGGLVGLALWGGGIYIAFNIVCNLWDAHQRGLARVRIYDAQNSRR